MLFEPPEGLETDRDRRLSAATDRIRGRFGREAVLPARVQGTGSRGTGNTGQHLRGGSAE
jgi:hypothetical protein